MPIRTKVCFGIGNFSIIISKLRDLSEWGYVAYFAVTTSLFYLALTMFSVPWYALGYELPSTSDDRTRLQAFVNVFGPVGQIVVAWFHPITQLKIFGDTIEGVRSMGFVAGFVLLVFGLIPAFFVKEPALQEAPRKKNKRKNRSFFRPLFALFFSYLVFLPEVRLGQP